MEKVLLYNPDDGKYYEGSNVLFSCDFEEAVGDETVAYLPVPEKVRISTIMGYLEICYALKRYFPPPDSIEGQNQSIIFQRTGEIFAVKAYSWQKTLKFKGKLAEDPMSEIAAMQILGCEHPNVLGCVEVLFDGSFLYAILPYCDSGDLFQRVEFWRKKNPGGKGGLPEVEARYWFVQLLNGLQYLQVHGICHRDLSPENVMINSDSKSLIIDMGMCILIPYTYDYGDEVTDARNGSIRRLILPQVQCGKKRYMSPEIFLNRDPFDGFAVDIWSAGTILFFMLTGASYQQPFDPFFQYMTSDIQKLMAAIKMDISALALHLVQNMLTINPRERYTLEEVLNHPWVKGN